MPANPKFLVLDFHQESRLLLARTLLRKFPDATIEEFDDAEPAAARVRRGGLTAIITHRTYDVPGADLVRLFRAIDPDIVVVMVSGMDRSEAAQAAGADAFLHYDEWLRIGTVVEQILAAKGSTGPNMVVTPLPPRASGVAQSGAPAPTLPAP